MTGALLWAALLPAAAWAGTHHDGSIVLWSIAAFVDLAASFVCHQIPARSFHLWGAQLPVCARCTGIYVGAAAAALVALSRGVPKSVLSSPSLALFVAAAPTIATLVIEWTTGASSNWIRATAGLPLGAAAVWVVIAACDEAGVWGRAPVRNVR